MTVLPLRIRAIGADIKAVADDVASAYCESRHAEASESAPPRLKEALDRFLTIAYHLEANRRAIDGLSRDELTKLGGHGLVLLARLRDWAQTLGRSGQRERVLRLLPALAVWAARHGAELVDLEPVVDALAELANHTFDHTELATLSELAGEIMAATSPAISQDIEKTNPGRPWRILNINRAILATRSQDPEHMESAFQTLIRNLPEEAPRFFSEGMEQMDALDYPPQVRKLMERYYQEWSTQTLH